MAKSILQTTKSCYLCGSQRMIEEHHIYSGRNRKASDKNGFVVYLCHNCHNEPPTGVHFNRERRDFLRRICQKKFEEKHTREEFMRIIGRNYL